MFNIQKVLSDLLSRAIQKAFPVQEQAVINVASIKQKGIDYVSPSPIKLFNSYKQGDEVGKIHFFGRYDYNPQKVAGELLEVLESHQIIQSTSAAGGFINFVISSDYLQQFANEAAKVPQIQYWRQPENKVIIVDYSSPNIAKEMHVGHLRSTIIGEAICRILDFQGNLVHRVNHLGDWGTQFGMLITYIQDNKPVYTNLTELLVLYKAAKAQFDKDPDFKLRSQLNVVKLQEYQEEQIRIWQEICEISRQGFNEIYKRLSIQNLKEMGESFYNKMLPSVIEECNQKGLIQINEGAKCIFIEGKEVPLMVQKKDGGYGYDSTDLAAIKYRIQEMKGDQLIYITDSGQEGHFELVFEAAKMAGWAINTKLNFMGFGVVLGEDGKKFKTRSGETVRLTLLLDEAKERALKGLQERLQEENVHHQTHISPEMIDQASEVLGVAAIKYFDLKQNRISTYKFDFNKMLDAKGNTAIYLIYAYARICSILRKAAEQYNQLEQKQFLALQPQERALALTLARFPEQIDLATEELQLHKITDLMFDIVVKFNEFYKNCQVIGNEYSESRLILCHATKKVLEKCFDLLAIPTIDRI